MALKKKANETDNILWFKYSSCDFLTYLTRVEK